MSLDLGDLINKMINASIDVLKEELDEVPDFAKKVFENEKESLKALAEARITGEISEREFENELKREKKVLEAELLTIKIMSKAAAQKAVNAALKVLTDAVKLVV